MPVQAVTLISELARRGDFRLAKWTSPFALALSAAAVAEVAPGAVPVLSQLRTESAIELRQCQFPPAAEFVLCATLQVPENRSLHHGRVLPIRIVVIPARNRSSTEGPIFLLGGGPGQTVTEDAGDLLDDWRREDHDIVLVDHRGTGEGHRLDCQRLGSDDNPQGYLRQVLSAEMARQCRASLERKFDLAQYTTLAAARDLEAARSALGYSAINLQASSYGTYLGLIYIREYPGRVRSAVLGSVVTLEDRSPLHMAGAAQVALDSTFRECETEPGCHKAFPAVRDDFYRILARLSRKPADATVTRPGSGKAVAVKLDRDAFAEAVRLLLYRAETGRKLPFLIDQARRGDYSTFAQVAFQSNRQIVEAVRFGLFLAITCNEAVARIRTDEIAPATEGTFIGDARVRAQKAACSHWPQTRLPANFFRSFVSSTPSLLLSYTLDPAIGARWAESLKASLPNSMVVMTAGGHSGFNDCTAAIARQVFRNASVEHLDLSCIPAVRLPPFELGQPGPPNSRN